MREALRLAEAAETEFARRKLHACVQLLWPVVEPATEFKDNWHIGCICEHLEAVSLGQIKNFCLNLPPRHAKSLLVCVFWFCWEWINRPHTRWLYSSNAESLALRDAQKSRSIIDSELFQARFSSAFQLLADDNSKIRFVNNHGGHRISTSVGGRGMGEGGDIICVDDAHKINVIDSDLARQQVFTWWDQVMGTRGSDPANTRRVIVMQRLSDLDLTGHVLSQKHGYECLVIPARYEPDRVVKYWLPDDTQDTIRDRHGMDAIIPTSLQRAGKIIIDPRTEKGDVLWPGHFGETEVRNLERVLGPWGCNPGEAPVLMADLSTKPISEVKAGDEVVGFAVKELGKGDPGSYARQHLTKAKVIGVYSRTRPVVKMTLDSGAVIRCTADHRWYRGKMRKDRSPDKMYGPVKLGGKLSRVCPAKMAELTADDHRLGGWLGGLFDGDGSVSACKKSHGRYRSSNSILFYQGSGRNSRICQKLEDALLHFGFDYSVGKDDRKGAGGNFEYRAYRLKGSGLTLAQKFLHIVRPTKWVDRIVSSAYGTKFVTGRETVVKIEPDGEEPVYALETTTGNYVVWGFASSNTAGQLQQRPSPEGGGLIKADGFRHFDEKVLILPDGRTMKLLVLYDRDGKVVREVKFDDCRWFQTCDTAMCAGQDNDYTVIMTMGTTPANDLLIYDVFREKVEVPHQFGKMIDQRMRHPYILFQAVEAKQSGIGLIQAGLMKGIPIRKLKAAGDKVQRAAPLADMYQSGLVYHRAGAAWLSDFEDEAIKFPNGRHDDQVDAAAYGAQLATQDALLTACRSVPDLMVYPNADEVDERSSRPLPTFPDGVRPAGAAAERYADLYLGWDDDAEPTHDAPWGW